MLHVLGYENVRAFPAGYGAWEAAQGEAGDGRFAVLPRWSLMDITAPRPPAEA